MLLFTCSYSFLTGFRAIGALLLYDITRPDSFKNVEMWLKETKAHATEKMSIVLVGNKSDLSEK